MRPKWPVSSARSSLSENTRPPSSGSISSRANIVQRPVPRASWRRTGAIGPSRTACTTSVTWPMTRTVAGRAWGTPPDPRLPAEVRHQPVASVPRCEHQSSAPGLGCSGRPGLSDAASVGPPKAGRQSQRGVTPRPRRLPCYRSLGETLPKSGSPRRFRPRPAVSTGLASGI